MSRLNMIMNNEKRIPIVSFDIYMARGLFGI